MSFLRLLIVITFLLVTNSAQAGTPYAKVVVKNLKIEKSEKKKLSRLWNNLLLENRKALVKPNKNYTVDQFCSFKGTLPEEKGKIDITLLKLYKHKENFDYNILALDFLSSLNEKEFNFKTKNPKKEVEFKLYYFAY